MYRLININEFNTPTIVIDFDNNSFYKNKNFEGLFNNKEIEDNLVNQLCETILSNEISSSDHSLVNIDTSEYLANIIKLSSEKEFLVNLIDTENMGKPLNEMKSIRLMKDEFFDMLSVLYDDFVIIDKTGVIVSALPNFETMYGISRKEAIGKTVFELEEKKIFNPSVAVRVLKSGKQETMLQLTGAGKYLMCTAIPLKDKDGNIEKIVSYTRDITKYQTLKDEYEKLEETLKLYSAEIERLKNDRNSLPSVIGKSEAVKNISSTLLKVSTFDATVLFLGESGVGKTMFAKLMHSQSSRKEGPFIEINCGAIPENLLESELFGYEKGAFSGANKEGKPGLIELSNNGTLFLDEIGDLPLHMQVKLLKTIQEKKIMRIGSSKEKEVDFRLITATNKNLEHLVKTKEFREDLYYRLNVITIKIPALRERKEDIFSLCNYFVEKINKKYELTRTLSGSVINYLAEYNWPGNIRELENTIEHLILTSDDYMITEESLPSKIKNNVFHTSTASKSLKDIIESVEKKIILDAYTKHKTSTGVAKELGISQPSASIKITKYLGSTR